MVAMTIDEEDAARKADLAAKEGAAGMNGQGGDKAKWDKEAQEDALARERWRAQRRAEIERERTKARHADGVARSKMGSVREVGREGFVRAVEREGWVLVLIYEPVRLHVYSFCLHLILRACERGRTRPGYKPQDRLCCLSSCSSCGPRRESRVRRGQKHDRTGMAAPSRQWPLPRSL